MISEGDYKSIYPEELEVLHAEATNEKPPAIGLLFKPKYTVIPGLPVKCGGKEFIVNLEYEAALDMATMILEALADQLSMKRKMQRN